MIINILVADGKVIIISTAANATVIMHKLDLKKYNNQPNCYFKNW